MGAFERGWGGQRYPGLAAGGGVLREPLEEWLGEYAEHMGICIPWS